MGFWPARRYVGVPVGVAVIAYHPQLAARVGPGDGLEEVEELGFAVPVIAAVGDFPVATSNAANNVVVPLRW